MGAIIALLMYVAIIGLFAYILYLIIKKAVKDAITETRDKN